MPASLAQEPVDALPGPVDPVTAAEAGAEAGAEQSDGAPESASVQAADVGTSRFATYRVFMTHYFPNTPGSVEVAVPDKCAKFAALGWTGPLRDAGCPDGYAPGLDYRVTVSLDNGATATFPVKDVGPWNQDDNYWNGGAGSPRPRRLFTNLPQGTPEAQAAFYDGYNTVPDCKDLRSPPQPTGRPGPADQFGRCVLNPAGLDLSVEAARQLGLTGNAWGNVTFLWEPVQPGSKPSLTRGNTRYLRQTLTGGRADFSFTYGEPTDIPLTGDWDGNGTKTPGVFRSGTFYLRNSNSTGIADVAFRYGDAGDVPIVGDWNSDGIETIGVFRRGVWYLRNTNNQGVADGVYGYGDATDTPLVGDWNGDGFDTFAVFRRGVWYITDEFASGTAQGVYGYGDAGDTPIVGDWNNDGFDTFGVVRGRSWYLSDFLAQGTAQIRFDFGDPGDRFRVWR